jgi:hypothetical protein
MDNGDAMMSMPGRDEKCRQNWSENLKEEDHLVDLGIDV